MANPFSKHHSAAGKAFSAGDHSKAMHHIGHMMMAVRGASKAAPSATTAPDASQAMDATQAGSDDDTSASADTAGVSTPAPMPANGHFFGQPRKQTPTKAPHVAGKAGLGATNHTVSGGFNRARFGAMKG